MDAAIPNIYTATRRWNHLDLFSCDCFIIVAVFHCIAFSVQQNDLWNNLLYFRWKMGFIRALTLFSFPSLFVLGSFISFSIFSLLISHTSLVVEDGSWHLLRNNIVIFVALFPYILMQRRRRRRRSFQSDNEAKMSNSSSYHLWNCMFTDDDASFYLFLAVVPNVWLWTWAIWTIQSGERRLRFLSKWGHFPFTTRTLCMRTKRI